MLLNHWASFSFSPFLWHSQWFVLVVFQPPLQFLLTPKAEPGQNDRGCFFLLLPALGVKTRLEGGRVLVLLTFLGSISLSQTHDQ